MSFIALLTQVCTRFYSPTADGFGGEGSYSVDTALVRWQDDNNRYEDADGTEWISSAIVYCNEEFELSDWLYLGTTSETDPQNVEGAYRIRKKYETLNPNGSILVKKYILG